MRNIQIGVSLFPCFNSTRIIYCCSANYLYSASSVKCFVHWSKGLMEEMGAAMSFYGPSFKVPHSLFTLAFHISSSHHWKSSNISLLGEAGDYVQKVVCSRHSSNYLLILRIKVWGNCKEKLHFRSNKRSCTSKSIINNGLLFQPLILMICFWFVRVNLKHWHSDHRENVPQLWERAAN